VYNKMTFCIAMKVEQGIVALADTRITSGSERSTARKVSVFEHGRHSFFLMTSGLRGARDKMLTYFQDEMEEDGSRFEKLYQAVNAVAKNLRRVASEDRQPLEESGMQFNLHCLIGGQLERDTEHKLYLLYPQGNWVEITEGTPYSLIGESSYGKPLLERSLLYNTTLETALKIGCLAFFSTRTATTDVDFPMDVTIYPRDSFHIWQIRFEHEDLAHVNKWWQDRLRRSIDELPSEWLRPIFPLQRPHEGKAS
jgi:putative proteasome-type protease